LGLPVFDVNQLIKATGMKNKGVEAIHKAAADAVMEEYTLLSVLPRNVADEHLSGGLHLKNLGTWVLKPDQFMHDLRFFLKHGLSRGEITLQESYHHPPKNLQAALILASNILRIASSETSGEQTLDFFNIFLAPFVSGLSDEVIRDSLRLFVSNLNQSFSKGDTIVSSLGLEFVIPHFLKEKEAVGAEGKIVGFYGDFAEESRRLASILLEVMFQDDAYKPIFNPRLIIKLRSEVFDEPDCESILFAAHKFAAQTGLPYFVNLCLPKQIQASYTSKGFRLAPNWRGDWELDTLRTGSVDSVIINLPRLVYESGGRENTFFNELDDKLELALQALEMKYRILKQREKENLLPFLMKKIESDQYFRIENSVRLISFVGLNETIQSMFGKPLKQEGQTFDFAKKVISYLSEEIEKHSKKPETRAALAFVPAGFASRRLAELDAEKYGWAKVRAQGNKERPYYTDLTALPLNFDISWKDRLRVEAQFHSLTPGGHLSVMPLIDEEKTSERLLSITEYIASNFGIGFYVFNRELAYCSGCQKIFYGKLEKCPKCGSVNLLQSFSRI
jgi:ribonucleoside-triphosphate reductase